MDILLLRDKDVASMIGMSASWVRVQRLKRRRGEGHSFQIDPVLIGSTPRYRKEEVLCWLRSLTDGGVDA